jgi:uncharacterized membrane protein
LNQRIPIAVVLCLQACLLVWALDLLPVWTDELFTLRTVSQPVPQIVATVQHDIHPPLYYLLLHEWTRLPLPWKGVAALRAFSALCALAATLLFDIFWARSRSSGERWLALVLFGLSPCLLLYGRMARSYSMQVALVLLSLGLLCRWMQKPGSARLALAAYAAMLSVLYTHYLPGAALLAGFALVGWKSVGELRAGVFLVALATGYLPWLLSLAEALRRWRAASNFSSSYTLTGHPALEQLLKIGFGAVSLAIGESFLVLSLLLVPVILVLAWRGARRPDVKQPAVAMLAVAAVIGYLGVSRWVSYPFIPARLLWLLPFLCLATALGVTRLRSAHLQRMIVAGLVLSYVTSTVLYFRRENFLNLGYAAPLPEIAATLNRDAGARDVILVDSFNTDFSALAMYLSGKTPMIALDRSSVPAARAAVKHAPTVWVVRNTRDISPDGLTPKIWHESCSDRKENSKLLEPYAPWQELAMKVAGFQPVPTHFYQLTACREQVK